MEVIAITLCATIFLIAILIQITPIMDLVERYEAWSLFFIDNFLDKKSFASQEGEPDLIVSI